MGFEPTIPVGEWPQTYALDRAATGTGKVVFDCIYCHFVYYIAKSLLYVSLTDSWDVLGLTVFKNNEMTL